MTMMTTMTNRRNAPDRTPPPGLLRVNTSGSLSFREGGFAYADLKEIDRQIRQLPAVKAHCLKKARELQAQVGDGFEVVISDNPDQERPRYFVAPMTSEAIRAELQHAVLLLATLGMVGH